MAIHSLRLPIELVLYQLFVLKLVPQIMTFEGYNFDIVMGVSALFIFLYQFSTKRKPSVRFFLVWNVIGLFFLITIVGIALLSAPLPMQKFAFNQPNIAVLKFPFIFLPAYLVPVVFLSHLLSIKK
jgi:hypothetical protein